MKLVLDIPDLHQRYAELSVQRKSFVDIKRRIRDIETLF
jgi:hypothetical protein